jgi:hypothetical protein
MAAWKFSASHKANEVGKAIDGDPGSRYSSGQSMTAGMWFAFDMQEEHELTGIVLDTTMSAGDYPRGFAVYTSANGTDWSAPILTGNGTTAITELSLPPGTRTRHIKIEQTGEHQLFWSIHELQVYGRKPN